MNSKENLITYIVFAMDAFFDIAMSKDKAVVWAEMLQQYSTDDVKQAFKSYIVSNGNFKPSLASIVHEIEKNRKSNDTSDEENMIEAVKKWEEVIESINLYSSNGFEHLDEITKKTVISAGGYDNIRMCDTVKSLPYYRKRFLEEYQSLKSFEKKTKNERLLSNSQTPTSMKTIGSLIQQHDLENEIENERQRILKEECGDDYEF